MSILKSIKQREFRRTHRVRNKLKSVASVDALRVSVFKSNKYFYAQVINDVAGNTVCSSSSLKIDDTGKTGIDLAKEVGRELAKRMLAKNISSNVYLDRGSFLYHGKVRAFADAMREGGISI